jgi:hypothetical protein
MDGAFCHYSLIALVSIGMFCNNIIQNYLSNKLWARTFQTSLCQSLVLSLLIVHKFCDECHRHLSSLCIISYLVKLIYVPSLHVFVILISSYSRHQPQSSLKSLSSESRDEILFRGEGCDSSCVCKLGI